MLYLFRRHELAGIRVTGAVDQLIVPRHSHEIMEQVARRKLARLEEAAPYLVVARNQVYLLDAPLLPLVGVTNDVLEYL